MRSGQQKFKHFNYWLLYIDINLEIEKPLKKSYRWSIGEGYSLEEVTSH